ncbi:MAG: CHAT domain-containing protein [Chloroflexota bacterium]|jgi:hypothetical protein
MIISDAIGPQQDYATLLISLEKSKRSRSTVLAQLEIPGWRYFDPVRLRLNQTHLLALNADPRGYGKLLGECIFDNEAIGEPYKETLAAVQARGEGVRVKLLIKTPELDEIHWERLYHPIAGEWRPIGSTALTPFSRFIRPQQWDRPLPVTSRPLSMLLIIASPQNLTSLFNLDPIPESERAWLKQILTGFSDLSVTCLESGGALKPTLNEIRAQLAAGQQFVHFLCHGAHSPAGSGLFLEDEHGQVDVVDQTRLVEAFKVVQKPPALIFLAVCESAKRTRADAMLPLAPQLVQDGGAQAAVAMSGNVGLKVAQSFSVQFYTRLLKHGMVDIALNEARALIQDDWDWGVPVLFCRLVDNQVIDFPIGEFYSRYLSHTDSAYTAIDEALNAARLEEHGQQLVDDLNSLVEELSKSHQALVSVADQFRRTGRNPADFAARFETFYYDFKTYYDNQTWIQENTSCVKIEKLSAKILPRLSPLLSPDNYEALRQELGILSQADFDLVRYFAEFLEQINRSVELIWEQLQTNNLTEAIQLKKDFEDQLSPSFQRSKAMFEKMTRSIRGVQRA